MPEETVGATSKLLSTQVTLAMLVGRTSVKPCVAVSVDRTCEVAVMVTALNCWVEPGITAGAVYNPALVIDPKFSPVGAPVAPLTDQFTSVLLSFRTVAVH